MTIFEKQFNVIEKSMELASVFYGSALSKIKSSKDYTEPLLIQNDILYAIFEMQKAIYNQNEAMLLIQVQGLLGK